MNDFETCIEGNLFSQIENQDRLMMLQHSKSIRAISPNKV